MARRGGFSSGFGSATTSPFGGGSFGGLGQYDIGSNLADLAIYEVEVKWGNGQASDAEYLAALQKGIDATDPGSHQRVSAQNKMDDAQYRIGRSVADKVGLDALIAFDQSALAKMNPESNRYRDVSDSLNSELAQRRSRDYGRLVDDYNAGTSSTKSLLAWVQKTVDGLPADAPDLDNWKGTLADLGKRVKSESDAQVYQDYQDRKMAAPAFLAYIEGRRNEFSPESPDFADWQRRLDDATRQIKTTEQAAKDQAFFDAYDEGKKSDKQYLGYMQARIAGMEPGDPDLAAWQHRLHQAVFSVAEDQLRFAVEHGKRPVSALIAFYKNYRMGVNPSSAEYRQLTRAIDSLAGRSFGGGGGGGGGGSASGGGGAGGAIPTKVTTQLGGAPGKFLTTVIPADLGKIIGTQRQVDNAMGLMAINPAAPKKDQKVAYEFFQRNQASLLNALAAGDPTWLFDDPRHPGKLVELPVSSDTLAKFSGLNANYNYARAGIALANHDAYHYALYMKYAGESADTARKVSATAVVKNDKALFEQTQAGIDQAMKMGDWATALNLSTSMAVALARRLSKPYLTDDARAALNKLADKLAENVLLPKTVPLTGQITSNGALDPTSITTRPDGSYAAAALGLGWHHVLDKRNEDGTADWGLQFDDGPPGQWEAEHVKVRTAYGGNVVEGEVKRRPAPTNSTAFVTTADGEQLRLAVPGATVDWVGFTDEYGNRVNAYSLDGGRTYIKPEAGTVPAVEFGGAVTKSPNSDGTTSLWLDGKVVATAASGGPWVAAKAWLKDPTTTATMDWYGKGTADTAITFAGRRHDVGGPGQWMTLITAGPDGSVNLLPPPPIQGPVRSFAGAPTMETRAAEAKSRRAFTLARVGEDGLNPNPGYDLDAATRPSARLVAQLPPDSPPVRYGTGFGVPRMPPLAAPVLPPLRGKKLTPPKAPKLPPLRPFGSGGGGLGKQPAVKPLGSGGGGLGAQPVYTPPKPPPINRAV